MRRIASAAGCSPHLVALALNRRHLFLPLLPFILTSSTASASEPVEVVAKTVGKVDAKLVFETTARSLESQKGFRSDARTDANARAEASMQPILAALPRNKAGNFEAAAVRYALHRHFVRRYGWHLHGLDPQGSTWNSSSPSHATIFRRLPAAVRSLVDERLARDGLTSSEVVALAVTLEVLVHLEALDRLQSTYAILDFPTNLTMPEPLSLVVANAYMTSFLLSKNLSQHTNQRELLMDITSIYPSWPQVKAFIKDLLKMQRPILRRGKPMAFPEVMHLIEGIHDGFGGWLKTECSNLKSALMRIEDHGTGSVLLSDFYTAGLNGTWQFQESVAYLKELGALDESDPGVPRVIIPNWVQGRSNCIGHAESHDTCCVSECEPLLAHIEQAIGVPAATPEELAAIVAALPSGTVPAREALPPLLLNRLHSIAAQHEGLVPIYGRLFAQWMHHAYPRECPYPHLAGTTKPANIFNYEQDTAVMPVAAISEMQDFAARKRRQQAPVNSAPWVPQEEIFAHPGVEAPPVLGWLAVHSIVALAALTTALLGLARTALFAARKAGAKPGVGKEKQRSFASGSIGGHDARLEASPAKKRQEFMDV